MSARSRDSLRSAEALVVAGMVEPSRLAEIADVAQRYAVAITPAMVDLIDREDGDDGIARQFVPDVRELETRPEEHGDPIGDAAHTPVRGVVHRYADRALLKIASVCPVYCRFCFRREMVGPQHGQALSERELAEAMDYIAAQPSIWEVILTGGDPFVLSDRRIAEVTTRLAAIAHVKVLRWHTRVPVVQPERVTADLAKALTAEGRSVWVAVHANHPRELTEAARAACRRLAEAGINLVSQTVLLKGVNDDAATLEALMRAFVETGIKPYYLHHADLAPGTAHLRTTIAEGQAIVRALRGRLSGLAQPTYVLDIPGGHGKVPVGPSYLRAGETGVCGVEDPAGEVHAYPPHEPPAQ